MEDPMENPTGNTEVTPDNTKITAPGILCAVTER